MRERYSQLQDGTVVRRSDGACIPPEPFNRDWRAYLRWKDNGGTTDVYEPAVESAMNGGDSR